MAGSCVPGAIHYKRVLVGLASLVLVAILLLVGSGHVVAGSYDRNAAEAYADTWT